MWWWNTDADPDTWRWNAYANSDRNCDGHANGHTGRRMSDGDHAIDQPNDNEWQLGLVQRRHTWVLPC
jgi:hypothetical protein